MSDSTPARVPFPIDEIAAAAGRDTISVSAPLKPASDGVAAAFRANFGVPDAGTVDTTARAGLAAEITRAEAAEAAAQSYSVQRAHHTGTQTLSTISDVTTVGGNLAKLTNPGAVRFLRINADNTVTPLSAADMLSALGGGGAQAVHDLGSNLTGTIAPDFANGSRQYCSLNGNSTIAPTGGADMDEMFIGIGYTNGAYTLDFSGVKMPPAVAALLPVTLEQYRCYLITLRYLGGGWTLMDISEANIESED